MMFGSTLIPLKLLVQHLISPSALHPAISMCWDATIKIPVVSTRSFPKELSINPGNDWLPGVMAFDTSVAASNDTENGFHNSDNDFLIAHVWNAFGEEIPNLPRSVIKSVLVNLIGWINGCLLAVSLVFSILVGDIWAAVLFFLYACHWTASTLVSYFPLVSVYQPEILDKNKPPPLKGTSSTFVPPDRPRVTVPENANPFFSIHERPEGGTIVFKGRQDTIESWARLGWAFNNKHSAVHWLWVITGTLAAIASVACMVNMYGALQLAFLGVLIYSSLAEILATRLTASLQHEHLRHARLFLVGNNARRTQAIIRASLEVDPASSLAGLDWIGMTLLPPMQVFRNMQTLLLELNAQQMGQAQGLVLVDHEKIRERLLQDVTADEQRGLAERLAGEMMVSWNARGSIVAMDV